MKLKNSFRPRFEMLEDRLTPAVNLLFDGANLAISGDPGAALTILQGGSDVTVSDSSGSYGPFAVTGNITASEASAWNMPLSTIPSGVTNQGALSISGNTTMTLGQGVYWFSSISIAGNAQLVATGPVKIYVTGNISITGNGMTTAGNTPSNMLIYGTVDPNNADNKTEKVDIGGNAAFYGAIYAPGADIKVNGNAGAAIYGAVTGNKVTLDSAALHWDEDLLNLGATTSVVVTTTNTTTYATTGTKRYLWSESLL